MQMHNPPHPGEVIRELCLKPLGLSVTGAAKALGVTRAKVFRSFSTAKVESVPKWQFAYRSPSKRPRNPG